MHARPVLLLQEAFQNLILVRTSVPFHEYGLFRIGARHEEPRMHSLLLVDDGVREQYAGTAEGENVVAAVRL